MELSVLAVIAPTLKSDRGHEFEYTNAVGRAAVEAGLDVRVLTPPTDLQLDRGLVLEPVLNLEFVATPGRSIAARAARGIQGLSRRLEVNRLARRFRSGDQGTLWFLHTAPYVVHDLVISAYLKAFPQPYAHSALVLVLRFDHYDNAEVVDQIQRVFDRCGRYDISLFTDSALLQERFTPLTPSPIGLIPIPLEVEPAPKKRLVGYFGPMRRQKGFHRLPDFVEAVRSKDPETRFFVQAYLHPDDPHDASLLEARRRLAEIDTVDICPCVMSSKAFNTAVASCAAVLIPYDENVYRAGTSGIAALALASGAAVVGTSGGWVEAEARHHKLSRFFSTDFSKPDAVGTQIIEAVELGLKPFLSGPAERSWIEFHTPRNLIEVLQAHSIARDYQSSQGALD